MVRIEDPEPVWTEPNAVPEKWIESVDENVLTSKLVSLTSKGPWSTCGKARPRARNYSENRDPSGHSSWNFQLPRLA